MDVRKFMEFMDFCKKNNIEPTAKELKAWWSLQKLENSERGKIK